MQIDIPEPGTSGYTHARPSLDKLPSFPCAKLKLDQFFLEWLSSHSDTVNALLDDVQAGRSLRSPSPAVSTGQMPSASPLSPSTAHALFATPPLSPSKARSPLSPLSPQRKSLASSLSLKKSSNLSSLPQFYFPTARETEHAKTEFVLLVEQTFAPYPTGMPQQAFVDAINKVCEIPRMVAHCVFQRLSGEAGVVTKDALMSFWLKHALYVAPPADRVFHCLRQEGQQYLTYSDFAPLLECILQYHPGLEFLKDTAEFQKKYAETVVYRIFYILNRTGSGKLLLRDLRRSDLMEALEMLDTEDDINKILKYFSYEHFYVIYCKFWELDSDHDFFIDRSDLAHYAQGALSYQIIDRIFEEVPRRFSSTQAGKMSYEDFVWFILSEEDKTTDTAIEYWFRCVDLECDNVIRPREMWFFYEEQMKRMDLLPSAETVLFEDVVCQLHDMLHPEKEGAYTLSDLKRTRPQSSTLFNALFNLHKFLSFENRDPFAARAEAGEFAGLSEWDKFAKVEYCRLASEDEQEDVQMEAEEGWPDG